MTDHSFQYNEIGRPPTPEYCPATVTQAESYLHQYYLSLDQGVRAALATVLIAEVVTLKTHQRTEGNARW